MIRRIFAIFFIYCCTGAAWVVLGTTMKIRTNSQDSRLKVDVSQLWGTTQRQQAPTAFYQSKQEITAESIRDNLKVLEKKIETVNHAVLLQQSNIDVDLKLNHRKKGLLWYSTYRVQFSGSYVIQNPFPDSKEIFVQYVFPAQGAVYDDFHFKIGNREIPNLEVRNGSIMYGIFLNGFAKEQFQISYISQGLDEWWYDFGADVAQVKDFTLKMTTDFSEIDFPENSISPSDKFRSGKGWDLIWRYSNLLSGVKAGMSMPRKLNPGPWVSEITYSAPISLFLFFFLLFVFSTLKKVSIHPVHYFFIGASFFSFHLLLAYLVDHVSIHHSFIIASFVSIVLVVSYMRLIAGARFALLEVGLSQFVYLVLFSYTFFFEQYTGLAVTILCVLTLFVVMQMTARVNWSNTHIPPVVSPAAAAAISCPYCRTQLPENSEIQCQRCGTLHHQTCWQEHGGCSVYGCRS